MRAFRRILATGGGRTYVTKVPTLFKTRLWAIAFMAWAVMCAPGWGVEQSTGTVAHPAEDLYLQLGKVGLDPARVYKVRGAALDRASVHITLEDGKIAFSQDVMGRITGAFFEGDGEILLTPPNESERKSLSLFTGMAILEERFATAYFRFNDETAAELAPDLRATDDAAGFISRWDSTARNLAQLDAMRMLVTMSPMLPVAALPATNATPNPGDRVLHARIQGIKLGVFDVYFDSTTGEQIQVGQARTVEDGGSYYDVWTSFSLPAVETKSKQEPAASRALEKEVPREDWMTVRHYTITTEVEPPKQIHAEARLQLAMGVSGVRMLVFELSRYLQVESVEMNGTRVEFIHNPAVEGTQLSRRGNDLVAVVLPEPSHAGQQIELRFVYGGEVLAEAGDGLLYVGARGTWYPNRGLVMADFDLEFHYPAGWTLVATGKPESADTAPASANGDQRMRWISERPIPLAGFNLGRYKMAATKAGAVTVEAYATTGVERGFPSAPITVIAPNPTDPATVNRSVQMIPPSSPSPSRNALPVAEEAARAINYYAERFGPFPFSRLALTQMPGPNSQGWPGLVFLSSYAFLNDAERKELRFEPFRTVLQQQIPAHEAAHQWWGDLITWSSYRDQWLSEGLANYCSMMMVQEKNPAGFREVMEKYRRDLLEKNKDGAYPKDAGPVTFGGRLLSSHFPEGYEAISYGRGTWLFHMLRTMLKDAALQDPAQKGRALTGADEPFVRSLRKVRERYQGKSINTQELLRVFAEDLPPALRFEGKGSLDWFLNSWINGTSLPKLGLKGIKFTPKGTGIIVSGTLIQSETSDDLITSIPVYAVSPGRSPVFLGRVFADGEETAFHLAAPAGTHKIVLDPNRTILSNLD